MSRFAVKVYRRQYCLHFGGGEDGTVCELAKVVTCDAKLVACRHCDVLSILGEGGSDS